MNAVILPAGFIQLGLCICVQRLSHGGCKVRKLGEELRMSCSFFAILTSFLTLLFVTELISIWRHTVHSATWMDFKNMLWWKGRRNLVHKTPYVNQQRNQSTVDFSRIHAYFWIYFNHAREGMYLLGGSGTDVRTRTREQKKKNRKGTCNRGCTQQLVY